MNDGKNNSDGQKERHSIIDQEPLRGQQGKNSLLDCWFIDKVTDDIGADLDILQAAYYLHKMRPSVYLPVKFKYNDEHKVWMCLLGADCVVYGYTLAEASDNFDKAFYGVK